VLATTARPVELIYANRTRDSVIFGAELRRWHDDHPDRLRVHHHIDADSGYLDREAVALLVAERLDADFYICGPAPFMDLVEATLLDAGVTTDRIWIERFETGGQPPPTGEAHEAPGAADAAEVTETVTLILRGKKTTVDYQPGDTILETARRGGLQPPFSCEAGNCATCMAFLRDGSVTMRVNNALTPEEVDEGWVLTCQSLPVTRTVTVEYESL
jgi:ferredoxin